MIKQFDDADEQEAATFLKKQKAREPIYKNINNDVARREGCSAEKNFKFAVKVKRYL